MTRKRKSVPSPGPRPPLPVPGEIQEAQKRTLTKEIQTQSKIKIRRPIKRKVKSKAREPSPPFLQWPTLIVTYSHLMKVSLRVESRDEFERNSSDHPRDSRDIASSARSTMGASVANAVKVGTSIVGTTTSTTSPCATGRTIPSVCDGVTAGAREMAMNQSQLL